MMFSFLSVTGYCRSKKGGEPPEEWKRPSMGVGVGIPLHGRWLGTGRMIIATHEASIP